MQLDKDGQPPASVNRLRNITKATESLLGLCRGLLADQELTDQEIGFLRTWLADNKLATQAWPGNVIAARVDEILADGIVTDDERADLMETLTKMTGMDLDNGIVSGLSNATAAGHADEIAVDGATFCFTGKFIYGPRRRCEEAVAGLGGIAMPRVTKDLDYLVIGALASRDWANTSHGRKIEKAIEYRDKGLTIAILEEEDWTIHIR